MKSMEPAMIATPAAYRSEHNNSATRRRWPGLRVPGPWPFSGERPAPAIRSVVAHLRWIGIHLAWLMAGLSLGCLTAAEKNPNSACLDCHSDKTLSKTNSLGKEISLFVDEARFAGTVHQ